LTRRGVFFASSGIGLAIAGFFLVGGIAFWIAAPGILIGQIWVFVALILIGVFGLIARGQAAKDRIQREGIRGTARVLSAEQTGVYVNEQPQMRLKLRVEAPGVTAFETEQRMVVPFIALATLGSGRPQTAYLDRENHDNLVIDWSAALEEAPQQPQQPAPAAPKGEETTLDRLQELMDLKSKQLISDEEFAKQKARILGEI
jgi:hypothetical protein